MPRAPSLRLWMHSLSAAVLAFALIAGGLLEAQAQEKKPNILVIMGDDIGWFNPSIYHRGITGYQTPNIDRIAKEGAMFTDWYGQQSCTAGRAAFVTGQSPIRTGLTKVGLPGADVGLRAEDPSIAELLKPLGYATGQFGKNHLGDKDEFLPTNHGWRRPKCGGAEQEGLQVREQDVQGPPRRL
jgi:arylsulfatase A-like enzyme